VWPYKIEGSTEKEGAALKKLRGAEKKKIWGSSARLDNDGWDEKEYKLHPPPGKFGT